MKPRFLLIILTTLLIFSCQKQEDIKTTIISEPNSPDTTSSQYQEYLGDTRFYPLQIGNMWTYKATVSNNGIVMVEDTIVIHCSGIDTINGRPYFHLNSLHPHIYNPLSDNYLRWSNGVCYSSVGQYMTDENPIIKDTLQLQDCWGWTGYYSFSYCIIDTNTTVSVVGQPFGDVAVVERVIQDSFNSSNNSNKKSYYKRDIGLIKQVYISQYGSSKRILELISYSVQ